jgi:hypothetical protein
MGENWNHKYTSATAYTDYTFNFGTTVNGHKDIGPGVDSSYPWMSIVWFDCWEINNFTVK